MMTAESSTLAPGLDAGHAAESIPADRNQQRLAAAIPQASVYAVIIPVYNHGGTLAKVVDDVLAQMSEATVFVINDGSTDSTAGILQTMQQRYPAGPDCPLRILDHRRNEGKGAALLTGFSAARDAGCTHAITIDSDGQHLVSDISRLMRISQLFPDDLIIGDRQMDFADVPVRSKRGRDMSRFWMMLQTGQDVPDTQCGLRIYPLKHTLTLYHIFRRFDFETETLVRHAWAGLQVRSAPITCIYFTAENRITHFRPVRDTLRGVRLNVMLTTWRIINPVPCRKCHVSSEIGHIAWRDFYNWRFWKRQLGFAQCDALADSMLATAVGVGVLIAVLPLYGVQTLLAIYTARRLHINIPVTLLATQVSLPPIIPFLVVMNIETGNLLLHGHWLSPHMILARQLSWRELFTAFLGPMMLGGLICGLALGTVAVLLTRNLLARMHRKMPAASLGSRK
jgi:glycosyltransferase involved in cell wall biosynthesis